MCVLGCSFDPQQPCSVTHDNTGGRLAEDGSDAAYTACASCAESSIKRQESKRAWGAEREGRARPSVIEVLLKQTNSQALDSSLT